jgi:hypothetical protein
MPRSDLQFPEPPVGDDALQQAPRFVGQLRYAGKHRPTLLHDLPPPSSSLGFTTRDAETDPV